MSLEDSGFVFVNVSEEASAAERRRNTRFARAHAAKINRRKHRAKVAKDRSGPAYDNVLLLLNQKNLVPGSGDQILLDREVPKIVDVQADQLQTDELEEPDPVLKSSDVAITTCCCSSSDKTSQDGTQEQSTDIIKLLSPQGPLTPIGAIRIETFNWDASTVSTRIAKHCRLSQASHSAPSLTSETVLHVTWPVMAGKEATSQWFHEFCTSPLVFDVAHMTAASHWDMAAGEFIWSEEREVVSRKQSVIETVRQRLDNVDALAQEDVETLIFAVSRQVIVV